MSAIIPTLTYCRAEVARHASKSSCWVIIHGDAYDVTEFLNEHPGGKNAILKQAGGDATEDFEAVHSVDILEKYQSQV